MVKFTTILYQVIVRILLYRQNTDLMRRASLGKLRKGDIKIVSEGIQFRRWLRENGYTLEKLSMILNYDYSEKTLNKYINPKMGHSKFKKRFYDCLGIKIDDIVVSQEDQVINLIMKAIESLQLYYIGTLQILEQLIVTTSPYGLYYELLSKVLLVYYHTSNNKTKESLRILEDVENAAKQNKFNDILVYIVTEYAYIHLVKGENKKALEVLESFIETETFKQVIDVATTDLNKKIIYTFYYRYGLALTRNQKYLEGRKQLDIAMKYTKNLTRIYMNIALSYKLQNYIKISIEYYYKALNECDNSIDKAAIYNNLANAYFKANEINKAKEYIKKSISLVDDTFHICETYNFMDSYFTIHQDEENCIKFKRIIRWTKKINKCTNYNYSQLFLFSVIKYCVTNNYMVKLEHVFDVLHAVIEHEEDAEVAKELMALGYKGIYYKKQMEES